MSENLENTSLSSRYLILKRQYEDLLVEHSKLQKEFSENFMIESMNDMKKQYEEKEDELDVMGKINDKLKNINCHLSDSCKTVNVMLSAIRSKVKDIGRNIFKNTDDYFKMYEIESNIKFVQDVVASSIKTKNELLYITD
jgi:hypothetical protein